MNRREFMRGGVAAATLPWLGGCLTGPAAGDRYPGWRPGELDIHFIHTGVGEQTFFIFPDGTTMLLDCGDTHHVKYMTDVPPLPNGMRFGGEWVSRYIQRLIPQREIDYAMVSHWHGDHTGDLMFGGKRTRDGRVVCGLPLVGEDFRFRHYFDHQYPEMAQHRLDPDPDCLSLMRAWLPRAQAQGMQAYRFEVGALNQIRLLKDPKAYPTFEIRNIAANAVVWDGADGTVDVGKTHVAKSGKDAIHENRLSSAIRIRYGNFSYYTGGDNELTMLGEDGREFSWEAMLGRVVGPVDVCKTHHHAGTFGMTPEFVREVRAQVYLSSVWQARMVDHKSLSAMCSRELYPDDRIVCFGHVADCRRDVVARYGADIAPAGHAVVKVAPGGDAFRVFTLDAHDEEMRILYVRDFVSRAATRFGVLSDTHVTGPESLAELKSAFRYLKSRRVDAVLHCGDLTDMGTLDQLKVFAQAWRDVFDDGTQLVFAPGNRDLMDTGRVTAEQKASARDRAIYPDPRGAFLKALGVDIGTGVYSRTVNGVPVVASTWGHEGELEDFCTRHPELAAGESPVVFLQHPHHQGTVFGGKLPSWAVKNDRATCWLGLFPDAISFSGHSHMSHLCDKALDVGAFVAAAAGSCCLEKGPKNGNRELSVLTVRGPFAELERIGLKTDRRRFDTLFVRRPASGLHAPAGVTFLQWNLGHFAFGKATSTHIAAAEAECRAQAFRALLARHRPDAVGLCEYSAAFDLGGARTRDRVLRDFASVEEGTQSGYQCNALAVRGGELVRRAEKAYPERTQKTYYLACEAVLGGRRTVLVETHLDLGKPELRRSQIEAILADFRDAERVIVSGDFNVSSEAEYAPFAAAGYEAANAAAFGPFPTHRRRSRTQTPAIDNVFVKGWKISGVCLGDYGLALSDHRPLVCRLV